MTDFTQCVERDAILVAAGMEGGFNSVCAAALAMSTGTYPELAGGPDTVLAHSRWLKQQPLTYISDIADIITSRERRHG